MNKIALVTGASRGLGHDMALKLAEKGIDLIITYLNNKDKAEEVLDEVKALGVKASALSLDVSKPETFDVFIDELKLVLKDNFQTENLDYLVNNAGIGIHAAFQETTEEQFDTLVNIHLKTPFFLTQKLLGIMNDGGGVVNISSGLTRFSFPGYDAYATMKGGVETLTKYQAKTLGSRNIRVNVVAPGAIETDFGGGAVRDNSDLNKMIASQTALGRVGLPHDIGSVVAFLCSDDAKWITGQRIEISGGMML